MKVVITKQHTINSNYMDTDDCPLYRAIREQHPEFPLSFVGGSELADESGNYYLFDPSKWTFTIMQNLKKGIIDKVELEIDVYHIFNLKY